MGCHWFLEKHNFFTRYLFVTFKCNHALVSVINFRSRSSRTRKRSRKFLSKLTRHLFCFSIYREQTLKYRNSAPVALHNSVCRSWQGWFVRETIITSGLPEREGEKERKRKRTGERERVHRVGCNIGRLKFYRHPCTTPLPPRLVARLWRQWKKATRGMNPRGYTATTITESRVRLHRNSPRSKSPQRAARIVPINYRR